MGNLKVESVAELTGHIVGMMVHSFLSKKLINLTAHSLGNLAPEDRFGTTWGSVRPVSVAQSVSAFGC